MTIIGQYNLLMSNDGKYAVEWHAGKKRHVVIIPHFTQKLQEMVEERLEIRRHFASLFVLAFSKNSDDEFLNHPDSIILNYLDDSETVPDSKLDQKQIFEFNVRKFLLAYNRWKSTELKFQEVVEFCRLKK